MSMILKKHVCGKKLKHGSKITNRMVCEQTYFHFLFSIILSIGHGYVFGMNKTYLLYNYNNKTA